MIKQVIAGIGLAALLTACPAKEEPKPIPNYLGISPAEYCQHHVNGFHMETAKGSDGKNIIYAISCYDYKPVLFAGTEVDK